MSNYQRIIKCWYVIIIEVQAKSSILTCKATDGITPPPDVTAPGCGAPCGGNILRGGGEKAATAAIGAATGATCSSANDSAKLN